MNSKTFEGIVTLANEDNKILELYHYSECIAIVIPDSISQIMEEGILIDNEYYEYTSFNIIRLV